MLGSLTYGAQGTDLKLWLLTSMLAASYTAGMKSQFLSESVMVAAGENSQHPEPRVCRSMWI